MVLAGLAVGCGIAEAAFRARDDGAFPHLNCYDADDELGVRLQPGCVTRNRVAGNPVTDIRINASGQRGGDLGAPAADEILVLGDSQAFGLGVNDDETFAAVLGELTGRPVVNAGVPTYGPLEYLVVARRIFETRHPRTVVYTVNMANDFFEHSRSDRERHAVWDHWAVRRETLPEHVTEFPGRDLLYQRSHAFFALRQLLHQTDATIDGARDVGFPSEGTLHDLVQEGDDAEGEHAAADAALEATLREHAARIAQLGAAVDAADRAVDQAANEVAPEALSQITEQDYEHGGGGIYGDALLGAARGHPGDIVTVDDEESSRDIPLTADLLARAVHLRRLFITRALRSGHAAPLSSALDAREAAEEAYLSERAREYDEMPVPSILEPRLREMAELCAAHGAQLIVVGLPLDVLVSETEFAKYGAEPTDVSGSRVLLTDLVRSAEAMGVRGLDATDALRAAEPGAFLDGDLHMTASGHRALATAIRDRLASPAPLARPASTLPDGRTPAPTPDELLHVEEITVTGSSRAHCSTQLVREWLRVRCTANNLDANGEPQPEHPTGVTVVSGGHGEAMTVLSADAATLLTPVLAGDELEVDFHWASRTQRLSMRWAADAAAPVGSFGERLPSARPEALISPGDARLCECFRQTPAALQCDYTEGCLPSCLELSGAARPECLTTYASDCAQLAACARGDLAARPSCPEGQVSALATGQCVALCAPPSDGEPGVPCASGTCTPWQGAHVCIP